MQLVNALILATIGMFLTLTSSSDAAGLPPLLIQRLISDSDIIAVANVSEGKPVGIGTVTFQGKAIEARVYNSSATVLRILKGPCPTRLTVEFLVPNEPIGYRRETERIQLIVAQSAGVPHTSNFAWSGKASICYRCLASVSATVCSPLSPLWFRKPLNLQQLTRIRLLSQ